MSYFIYLRFSICFPVLSFHFSRCSGTRGLFSRRQWNRAVLIDAVLYFHISSTAASKHGFSDCQALKCVSSQKKNEKKRRSVLFKTNSSIHWRSSKLDGEASRSVDMYIYRYIYISVQNIFSQKNSEGKRAGQHRRDGAPF